MWVRERGGDSGEGRGFGRGEGGRVLLSMPRIVHVGCYGAITVCLLPQALSSGDIAQFPDITLAFNGGASLVIPPQNYWVEVQKQGGQNYYMFGVQASDQFIVGDVAMQVRCHRRPLRFMEAGAVSAIS